MPSFQKFPGMNARIPFQEWMIFFNIDMIFAALQGIMIFIKGHSNPNFFLAKLSALETCMYFSEALWRNGKQRNQTKRPIWKIKKVSLNIKQCILSLILTIFYSKIGKHFLTSWWVSYTKLELFKFWRKVETEAFILPQVNFSPETIALGSWKQHLELVC